MTRLAGSAQERPPPHERSGPGKGRLEGQPDADTVENITTAASPAQAGTTGHTLMVNVAATLTVTELDRLTILEGQIGAGIAAFIMVGNALAEVRDSRLYRAEHAKFEDYLKTRWNLSRPRAYELMSAAEVVSGMSDTPELTPKNARRAVALAAAPAADRPAVMVKVMAAGRPTGAAITAEVVARRPAPRPAHLRGTRHAIPDRLVATIVLGVGVSPTIFDLLDGRYGELDRGRLEGWVASIDEARSDLNKLKNNLKSEMTRTTGCVVG